MIYLKVKETVSVAISQGVIKRSIVFVLGLIFPKANPDFEKRIDSVNFWLLEFEDEDSAPTREIGLGHEEDVLMKMPYKKNYGYWVDNSLVYKDFKNRFECTVITKDEFERKWNFQLAI